MLELAGSSVVDWVQGLVTKALSELRVSKHKTYQYAHYYNSIYVSEMSLVTIQIVYRQEKNFYLQRLQLD